MCTCVSKQLHLRGLEGGGDCHMKWMGMLVISLLRVQITDSGLRAFGMKHQLYLLGLHKKKKIKTTVMLI